MAWTSLLPKDGAWLSAWEWRLWWAFVVLGVLSGLCGYAAYVIGRHRGDVESALVQRQLDIAREDLTAKDRTIGQLQKEAAEAKALASRDLPKPPSADLRQRVLDALRNLGLSQNAPTVVILDRYNENSSSARSLMAQLEQFFGDSGIPHQKGTIAGMTGFAGAQPPYQIKFAPGSERRAQALAAALRSFIVTDPILREAAGLPVGAIRLSIVGQIDFHPDGSVLAR
jgi:hypothetical protein